jgi:hypothetical protein
MTDFSHIRKLLEKATPGDWRYEGRAQHIIHDDAKGMMQVADIRGWGHLTGGGHGAWGMDADKAASIQDANGHLITALRNNAEAMLGRIDELEAGLRRIDVGLTKAIDMDNALILDDMATQVRDLSRELLDSNAS